MKILHGFHSQLYQKSLLAIGNFDGVHRGHQAILSALVDLGRTEKKPTALLLFEPQPLEYFQGESAPKRLTPFHQKVRLLSQYPIDYLICQPFNALLAQAKPQTFIEKILIERFQASAVLVGEDFRFGYQRQGELSHLQAYEGALTTYPMPTTHLNDEKISSTRVRQALLAHDFKTAHCLLGRPFGLTQRVRPGYQRGRHLGFPTLNLLIKHPCFILSGVFAAHIVLDSGQVYQGVINIGKRPTVDGSYPLLEAHLFGFSGDLYGEEVSVYPCYYLRGEAKFASLDQLKAQIHADVAQAQAYFASDEYRPKIFEMCCLEQPGHPE